MNSGHFRQPKKNMGGNPSVAGSKIQTSVETHTFFFSPQDGAACPPNCAIRHMNSRETRARKVTRWNLNRPLHQRLLPVRFGKDA